MKIRSFFTEEMPNFHSKKGQLYMKSFIKSCRDYENERLLNRTNLYAYVDRQRGTVNFRHDNKTSDIPVNDHAIIREVLKNKTYDERFLDKNPIKGLIMAIDTKSYFQLTTFVQNAKFFNSLFRTLPKGQREKSFPITDNHESFDKSMKVPSLYLSCLKFLHVNLCEIKEISIEHALFNYEKSAYAIECLPLPAKIKKNLLRLHYTCPNRKTLQGFVNHGEQNLIHFIVPGSAFHNLLIFKETQYANRETFNSIEKILIWCLLKSQQPQFFQKDEKGKYIHNPYGIGSSSWGRKYRKECPKIIPFDNSKYKQRRIFGSWIHSYTIDSSYTDIF